MAYLLKTALGFAHSGEMRRIEGKLQAETLLFPAFRWRADRLWLRSLPLPGRIFSGRAYERAAPPWLGAEAAVQFDAPASGPRRADPAARRRFLLTPLGRFCGHPEVRLALAQDRFAAWLAPFLCAPDLLDGEDELLRDWDARRPAAASGARASAAALETAEGPLSGPLRGLRRRLRLATLRRLDAAAVGREVFQPCPVFFGEPYWSGGEDGGDGPPVRLKAGIVVSAQYWPKAETEARSRAWREDEPTVAAAERSLFPFLPPAGPRSPALFSAGASLWLETAPLREFEARSELPLFPARTIFPEGTVPPGFRLRIQPETMRACGGSYLTLAAAELSPYIAEPFLELCGKYRELLAAWAEDTPGLAAAKWAALAPPTSSSPVP